MSVTVNPPKSPVTKASKGVAAATVPNVCKMPGPPAPFVPTPLPNVGKSGESPKGYSKNVKVEGHPVAIKGASFGSVGDAASKGTGGGLVSANTHGPATFVGPGSLDVKFEGKNVHLLGDPMLNNCDPSGRTPNSATMVGVLQPGGLAALFGDEVCPLCGKEHGAAGKLEESTATKGDADLLAAAAGRAVAKAQIQREARVAAARAEAEARARAKYEAARAKLQANIAGAGASGNATAVATLTAKLAALRPETVNPQSVSGVEISAMLGVVRCKDGKVYAGTSSFQLQELGDEMPAGWHTPVAQCSLHEAEPPDFPDQCAEFQKFVTDKKVFAAKWKDLNTANRKFRKGHLEEPHYPPGRCAAQQMLLLALEHGGRPVGLTERTHRSADPTATVQVYVRDSPTAAPRMGSFGGTNAVPPCGTCQVILTMLMCPDERPKECQHRAPAGGVCRCT
ncbi:PAAR-like domain-containing protein [Enhygromyxa salina]|uniref:PAAR-like domain-containing protein n=1 Tax=Enhygromyxa salina TaxID=215803 RepID=UPI000698A7F5|nr:PAAR-like domain-containing protein [Enhygromyxa salina]